MDQVILAMLDNYHCVSDEDFENALKEIIQQTALLGLWRAKFFEHAAFYGGTALRILYKLDRFSEDLDFSLLQSNMDFKLNPYLSAIQQELNAFGFETEVSQKLKSKDSQIQSAFLRANTLEHLIRIQAPEKIQSYYHGRKQLKIKLEVDTQPPSGFKTETKALLSPIPFWIKTYSLADLFAGKIAAVLCRNWKTRIKGRDWYDFLWFIQRETKLNLTHLETKLRDFGFYTEKKTLTGDKVKALLIDKFKSSDLQLAINDISKFLKQPSRLDGWTIDLFIEASNSIRFTDSA